MRFDDYKDIMDRKRPILHHHPMEIAHRAKQFAPFAALKGFEETVEKQEVIYTERPVLSEDQKEILDRKLSMLKEEGEQSGAVSDVEESNTEEGNVEGGIKGNVATVTWFESNRVTWTRRITNQVKRKADEEVRLYKKLQAEDLMSDDLGLRHRMTGRVHLRDHILWIEGMDEGILVEHITDIQMSGTIEGN